VPNEIYRIAKPYLFDIDITITTKTTKTKTKTTTTTTTTATTSNILDTFLATIRLVF
jgi:hypothetical protein